MILTKPLQDITFQNVVDFCDAENIENEIVEYKSNFPSNETLVKTISAFANTYGGILIIGVNSPSGKPIPPFDGIQLDSQIKYGEKIENICLYDIKEPIFPQIKICKSENGKSFVVVKVEESDLSPHRIANNTTVYIRTGQSSTPNEKAEWDKIEWLQNRRKKSIEFKKYLVDTAEEYFLNSCKLQGIYIGDKNLYFGVLSLQTIPVFPYKNLRDYKDFQNIEDKITINDSGRFPYNLYDPQLVQSGIQKLYIPEGFIDKDTKKPQSGAKFLYTYLNSFGLYLYKEDIGYENTTISYLEITKLIKRYV